MNKVSIGKSILCSGLGDAEKPKAQHPFEAIEERDGLLFQDTMEEQGVTVPTGSDDEVIEGGLSSDEENVDVPINDDNAAIFAHVRSTHRSCMGIVDKIALQSRLDYEASKLAENRQAERHQMEDEICQTESEYVREYVESRVKVSSAKTIIYRMRDNVSEVLSKVDAWKETLQNRSNFGYYEHRVEVYVDMLARAYNLHPSAYECFFDLADECDNLIGMVKRGIPMELVNKNVWKTCESRFESIQYHYGAVRAISHEHVNYYGGLPREVTLCFNADNSLRENYEHEIKNAIEKSVARVKRKWLHKKWRGKPQREPQGGFDIGSCSMDTLRALLRKAIASDMEGGDMHVSVPLVSVKPRAVKRVHPKSPVAPGLAVSALTMVTFVSKGVQAAIMVDPVVTYTPTAFQIIVAFCVLLPLIWAIDRPSLSELLPWCQKTKKKIDGIIYKKEDDFDVDSPVVRNAINKIKAELAVNNPTYQPWAELYKSECESCPGTVEFKSEIESTTLRSEIIVPIVPVTANDAMMTATLSSSAILLGLESVCNMMPESRIASKEWLLKVSHTMNTLNTLVTGPRWFDNDSVEVKLRFILHTIACYRRFDEIMKRQRCAEQVRQLSGLARCRESFQKMVSKGRDYLCGPSPREIDQKVMEANKEMMEQIMPVSEVHVAEQDSSSELSEETVVTDNVKKKPGLWSRISGRSKKVDSSDEGSCDEGEITFDDSHIQKKEISYGPTIVQLPPLRTSTTAKLTQTPNVCVSDYNDLSQALKSEVEGDDIEAVLSSYPEVLQNAESLMGGFKHLFHGKTYTNLQVILTSLALSTVSDAWEVVYPQDLEDKGFCKMLSVGLDRMSTAVDATEGFMQAILYFVKFFYNMHRTRGDFLTVYNWMENADEDVWWYKAQRLHHQLKTGQFHHEGYTTRDIWSAFCVAEKNLMARKHQYRGLAKQVFERQRTQIMEWKEDWKAYCTAGTAKMQPYSLLIHGPPGIGKTVMLGALKPWLHHIANISDPVIKSINEGDAYDTGLDTATTCLVWDDIGNVLPNKRTETITAKVIRFVNSEVTAFTGASIEEKGNKFNHAAFFLATTNDALLGVMQEASQPEAVWRRMGRIISVTVKKEYALNPDALEEDRRVDWRKIDQSHVGLPKHLDYRVCKIVTRDNKPPSLENCFMNKVFDHVQLMHFLLDDVQTHFNKEQARMEAGAKTAVTEYCPHKLFPDHCTICKSERVLKSEILDRTIETVLNRSEIRVLNFLNTFIADVLVDYITAISSYAHRINQNLTFGNLLVFLSFCIIVIGYVEKPVLKTECSGRLWWKQCATTTSYDKMINTAYVTAVVTVIVFGIIRLITAVVAIPEKCLRKASAFTVGRLQEAIAAQQPFWFENYWHWFGVAALLPFAAACLANIASHVIAQNRLAKALTEIETLKKRTEELANQNEVLMSHKTPNVSAASTAESTSCSSYSRPPDYSLNLKSEKQAQDLTQSAISLEEKKKMVDKDFHSWKTTPSFGHVAQGKSKNMTKAQFENILRRNIVVVQLLSDGIEKSGRSHGLFMCTNILVVPKHMAMNLMTKEYFSCVGMEVKISTFIGTEPIVNRSKITSFYSVPDQDIMILHCVNGMPYKNIADCLPLHVARGDARCISSFYTRPSFSSEIKVVDVLCERSVKSASHSGPFEAWDYTLPWSTKEGMCCSVLVRYHKGVVIEGFHLAGAGESGKAIAGILTYSDFVHAQRGFEQDPNYIFPIEPTGTILDVNVITNQALDFSEELHPKSIGRFQPPDMSFIPLGDIPKVSRASRCTIEANPHIRAAVKYFGFDEMYGRPLMELSKNMRRSMILGTSTENRGIDVTLLNAAFDDYVSVVPEAVQRTSAKSWFIGRPLSYDEIVLGVDGHPYVSSIKVNTSAGFPFNTKKKNLMCYDPVLDRHLFDKRIADSIAMFEAQVLCGTQSGVPFNASLKNESRLKEKCDKARVFFADSTLRYIVVQKWLAPLIHVINDNSTMFETSIGQDRLSPKWHEHMQQLMERPDRCIASDFSTYDHSQDINLRAAAANVFVRIAELVGYSKQEQENVRAICSEFLYPILHFAGYVALGQTIQPSGTNLTAHTNGIAGSLLARMSYFSKYPNRSTSFREDVAIRNLGDDIIGVVLADVDWNCLDFQKDCETWGLIATPPTKNGEISALSNLYDEQYLKSKLYYNEDIGCCIGVLDPVSIFKPLQYFERSEVATFYEQHIDTLKAVLRECFFYGRECHDWCQNAIRSYLLEIGFSGLDDFLLSNYESKVAQYKIKFPERLPNIYGAPTTPSFPKFWEQYNSEIEGEEGVTDFVVETTVAGESEPINFIPMTTMDGRTEMNNFFERPVKAAQFLVNFSKSVKFHINPFEKLFADPIIKEKLQTYAVGRAGVELTFTCSKNPGHAALFQISSLPLPNKNYETLEDAASSSIRHVVASQRDCLYWDLSADGGATYKCNFVSQFSTDWLFDHSFDNMHRVIFESVTDLLHVSNNDQPITVTVYARFTDFEFSGSTSVRLEAEKYSTVLSAVADVASMTSKYLSWSPGMAMVTDYAAMAFEGAAGVARYFGHSRPVIESQYDSVYTSPPLATMNSNLNGRTLALDRDQGVSMSAQISGSTAADELVFSYHLQKWNLIGTFEWSSQDAAGSRILSLGATCCDAVYERGYYSMVMTNQALISANFMYAHWRNQYRIRVITPKDNGGALHLVYEPTGFPTKPSTLTNRSLIVDMSVTNVIDIDLEWQQPDTVKLTNKGYCIDPFATYIPECMNGGFSLFVENPLAPFSAVPQKAIVVVESRIRDDAIFGNYQPMDMSSWRLAFRENAPKLGRNLLPARSTLSVNRIGRGPGLVKTTNRTSLRMPRPSAPTSATSSPSAVPIVQPPSTAPTTHVSDLEPTNQPHSNSTSSPTSKETNAPSSKPSSKPTTKPTIKPSTDPTLPPTPIPCQPVLTNLDSRVVGVIGQNTTPISPVYVGVGFLAIPAIPFGTSVFAKGVNDPGEFSFTVTNSIGLTVTSGGSSITITQVNQRVVFHYTHTGWVVVSVSPSESFQLTNPQATIASGYVWQEFAPSTTDDTVESTAGIVYPVKTLGNPTTFSLPGFPSSDVYCGTGNVGLVVHAVGRLQDRGQVKAILSSFGAIVYGTSAGFNVTLGSGYDTPLLKLHSVWAIVPYTSQTEFGSPFKGRDLIAPIHFGEQVMSIRALWKVFKQKRYIILDGNQSSIQSLSTIHGLSVGGRQDYIYNFQHTTFSDSNALGSIDEIIFNSFMSVRGSMVSHYTVESGDGLVKFRRPNSEGESFDPHRRGFEQFHTSVQRSIVINWPCYMRERFHIPRQIGNGTQADIMSEVIFVTKDQQFVVREDTAIGEDFSLSYFIGVPRVFYDDVLGSSTAPPYILPSEKDENIEEDADPSTFYPTTAIEGLPPQPTPESLGTYSPTQTSRPSYARGGRSLFSTLGLTVLAISSVALMQQDITT